MCSLLKSRQGRARLIDAHIAERILGILQGACFAKSLFAYSGINGKTGDIR